MSLPLVQNPDGFEVVRDQIATILAAEILAQQDLAVSAVGDPLLWKLRVYSERSDPWGAFQGDSPDDTSPLVNVWYESGSFDESAGNIVSNQTCTGIFNIDCYGYAVSTLVAGGGHIAGDRAAALEVHRAVRLVRAILMSGPYRYLGLQGTVGKRWVQSVAMFQPQEIDGRPVQNVMAARVVLSVRFLELAPQYEGDVLEFTSVTVRRAEDGEIVVERDYDYTT